MVFCVVIGGLIVRKFAAVVICHAAVINMLDYVDPSRASMLEFNPRGYQGLLLLRFTRAVFIII